MSKKLKREDNIRRLRQCVNEMKFLLDEIFGSQGLSTSQKQKRKLEMLTKKARQGNDSAAKQLIKELAKNNGW